MQSSAVTEFENFHSKFVRLVRVVNPKGQGTAPGYHRLVDSNVFSWVKRALEIVHQAVHEGYDLEDRVICRVVSCRLLLVVGEVKKRQDQAEPVLNHH